MDPQEPYATVADLKLYRDWRQVADWVSTNDARGTEAEFDDNDTVLAHLRSASGRIQSACLVRKLYTHKQLADLVESSSPLTNSKAHLIELTVRIALYTLSRFKRRAVDTDIEEGYRLAMADLERLTSGVRIFGGFDDAEEAGLPKTTTFMDETPNRIVRRASRYFGYRNQDGGE